MSKYEQWRKVCPQHNLISWFSLFLIIYISQKQIKAELQKQVKKGIKHKVYIYYLQ